MFRRIKYEIIKFVRARATAHEIAYGAAIGAFISIFPTFGAGTILVIFAYRFIKFNLLAAISASTISNVVTAPFFVFLSFKIGSYIWKPESTLNLKTWYKHLDEVGISVLIGGTILSIVCGILVYFIVKFSVESYRRVKKVIPKSPE